MLVVLYQSITSFGTSSTDITQSHLILELFICHDLPSSLSQTITPACQNLAKLGFHGLGCHTAMLPKVPVCSLATVNLLA
tara:strand:- start:213 stop:452 length:240 start_codon:yes stop_codon:yes gene_type:complete